MPRPHPETVRLLHGPYLTPKRKRGARAYCHLRACAVVITSWSDGRIPWPRCRAVGARGGSGLLVDDELLRALRTDAAAAVAYWWGVFPTVVSKWRRLLGVERLTEGSAHLHRLVSARGAAAVRARVWTPAERAAKRERARAADQARHVRGKRWPERPWTPAEWKLLGTMADGRVAARVGRSRETVRRERVKHGIPAYGPNGVTRD